MRVVIRLNESRRAVVSSGRFQLLSKKKRRQLSSSRHMLKQNLNLEGILIDVCLRDEVLRPSEASSIKAEEGGKRQVRRMIKFLKRRPDTAFDGFIRALGDAGQEHVAQALQGNAKYLMTDFHKNILRRSRKFLVKHINPEGELHDELIANYAITYDDLELIKAEKTWRKKVRVLLDRLIRRPDFAFQGFIKALLISDQQHVANALLHECRQVSVRLNLKRKRTNSASSASQDSSPESPEPCESDDLQETINRLINDGLHNIQELLDAKRRGVVREQVDPGDLKWEYVEKLVDLLQNFEREITSVEMGSIVIGVLCRAREAAWDLKFLCLSEEFLAVCRSALIPKDLLDTIEVEISVNDGTFHGCVDTLDQCFPPPSPPFLDGLPPEMFHMILHKALSAREVGIDVRPETLFQVKKKWRTVLHSKRFQRDHKRFVESSMKPYLFSPILLESSISIPSPSSQPKAIIGVCILGRRLYIARSETPLIEVFKIPDIRSTHLSVSKIDDHRFVSTIEVPAMKMPFNMAASDRSKCLYLTDFSDNVGCVWRVIPENENTLDLLPVRKFVDDIGRPIGINVSRDDYVIVVTETPDCVRVFSRHGERMRTISLPPEIEAPRQAVCTEPGRYALIHGYLEPLNRVVELDDTGSVFRSYGSVLGSGFMQIHWPAALICDSRGRMLVGDRENRRVHLVRRDFRFKRHLLQLDLDSVARPRRLCLDDVNGTIYVGHTDPTIKVFRVSYPGASMTGSEELEARRISCFSSSDKKEVEKAKPTGGDASTTATAAEAGAGEKKRYVLPPGEYRPMANLNELPVEYLKTIFLKASTIKHRLGLRATPPRDSRLHGTLVSVCRKWYNIVNVLHFSYRLGQYLEADRAAEERRIAEALKSQEQPAS